ncbi:MAG: hypothetical protein HY870_18200 [Chloroflexi bacterium]|nr:hypothetical protein [Chloroflexota bacterium]
MKQATFITGLSCVGFAVGLAAFIGSRLSEQAIALMAGAIFGMLVALPIGALIGWAVKGSRSIERNTAPSQPMVIMTQPQLPAASPYITAGHPGWQQAYPVAASAPQLQPRKYTIGGEEIINHESVAVW